MKKIIGLMGNSGAGKSSVAKYLAKKGAKIIDADEISHEICEKGEPGYVAVKENFDTYFFNDDETLNRRRLGRHVFANKSALQKLENILHPIIVKKVEEEVASSEYEVTIVDCALLVRTGLYLLVDEVWIVTATEDTKLNRICARDNISFEQALNRLRNQTPDSELMKYAQTVIVNDGTQAQLYEQVEEAFA